MKLLDYPSLLKSFVAELNLFHSALLILLLCISSFGLSGQKIIELKSVDTIDHNSILEIFSLDEHLKFYHPKQLLDIKIAYKAIGGKYNFKESFQKSGTINYAAIHLGSYKFIITNRSSTCRCVIIMNIQKVDEQIFKTLNYDLNCWDAKFPNPNKPIRKI